MVKVNAVDEPFLNSVTANDALAFIVAVVLTYKSLIEQAEDNGKRTCDSAVDPATLPYLVNPAPNPVAEPTIKKLEPPLPTSCFELNVDQLAELNRPLFVAEAVGILKVCVVPTDAIAKSVPELPLAKVCAASLWLRWHSAKI